LQGVRKIETLRDDVDVSTVWGECSNSYSGSDSKITLGRQTAANFNVRSLHHSQCLGKSLETIASPTMSWKQFRDHCFTHNMYTENGVNHPAPNTAHNSNFSLLLVLGKERLTGPNYMDWMRNLRFTLRYENKEYVLDEQIPTIDDDSTQEEIEAYQKHYDDAKKMSCIMASSMSPELQKTFKNTWAYEMNQ
ncbi:hypothetical protein Tco_0816508, partial [Tanacetum coccineum]